MPEELISRCRRSFVERFGAAPAFATSAPGRVNLIGDHTDYNNGLVLPVAIDRWCVCVGSPANGARSTLRSVTLDQQVEVPLGTIAARGAAGAAHLPQWARYVVGAIAEHARCVGLGRVPEIDLVIDSTVPVGGGLSSSASLETASALALEAATGRTADPVERARACQAAEHAWAGVPCGLMDQLASGCAVAEHALLLDCNDGSMRPIRLPDAVTIVVIDSGVRHELADGEYAARRRACAAACERLEVGSLQQLSMDDRPSWEALPDGLAACVRHVVLENDRVARFADALSGAATDELGPLMAESHASLRDDYRVSCGELDLLVELLGEQSGVLGARMTGGGFGGSVVALTRAGAELEVGDRVVASYAALTGLAATASDVRAVGAAKIEPR